jgi:hypothetical protein
MTVPNYATERALSVTTAAAIAVGELVGINSSGLAVLADCNTTPIPARGFAVSGGASGARITICRSGRVEGFTSLTAGGTVYLSGTAGGITQTRPSTVGDIVQAVGYAVSATAIDFEIVDPAFVIQAAGNSTIA